MTRFLLFAIILLAPLPLGSNRPLAEALLIIASAIALICWGWRGSIALPWRHIAPVIALFTAIWFWLFTGISMSVDASTSLIAFMRTSAYFALFLLAVQLARDAALARRILQLIAFSSAFYAAYGLCVYALGNDHILWLEKWAYTDSLTATFVNRNAFAAYAGMGLVSCLALFAQSLSRENGKLQALWHKAQPQIMLLSGCIAILVLAIILTHSRAGIVSIAIALSALWAGLWLSRSLPRKSLALLGFTGLLVLGGSLLLVGERLIQRTANAPFMTDDRPQIWASTYSMIQAAPLTGHGAGTYEQMFLQYRTPTIKQVYSKAHSSYLEMAAGTGIPATLIFFCGMGLIGLVLLRGIRTREQNKIYPIWSFAILAQAGAHSLVDFSFQTPANAAIFSLVLGAGVAQSFSSQQA